MPLPSLIQGIRQRACLPLKKFYLLTKLERPRLSHRRAFYTQEIAYVLVKLVLPGLPLIN
ncbi:unnamed protein product [Meloidogyne enterolobii]|uniref:Uncharacterized protein n=1 Tax=Meloidogyne enterolobii TaxID=390850 RepID=A0ACB0ZAV1_MELEN